MARKRTRRVLFVLGAVVALLLVLLLALPVWFPWFLRQAAPSYGLKYAGYDRVGYSRFVLSDVTFTNQGTVLKAGRLEGFVPSAWLWNLYVAKEKGAFAQVKDWHLSVRPAAEPAATRGEPSIYEQYRKIERTLNQVHRWLPKAVLERGTLVAGGQTLEVPRALWKENGFSGEVGAPQYQLQGEVTSRLQPGGERLVEVRSDAAHLASRIMIREQPDGLLIQSTNSWRANPILGEARFGREGVLPLKASVAATGFRLPADLLQLQGYQAVTGNLSLQWITNQFFVDLAAHATPTNAVELPPVDLKLAGSGNMDYATVQRAEVHTPWLELSLREGAVVQFTSPFLQEQTSIPFLVSLSEQHWVEAKGKLEGQIELRPGQGALPDGTFSIRGENLAVADIQSVLGPKSGSAQAKKRPLATKSLIVEGEMVWPELRLNQARVETADGSSLSLNGIADLGSHMVHYGQFAYEGGYAREWLPPGMTYSNATISGNLNGPWTNLSHSGQVKVKGLRTPLLPVVDLSGSWKGEQLRLDPIQLSLDSARSTLAIGGAIDLGKEAKRLRVAALSLAKEGVQQLVSQRPFELAWEKDSGGAKAGRVTLTPMEWSGTAGSIQLSGEVTWPIQGHLVAEVQRLGLDTFSAFVPAATNQVMVNHFQAAGGWSNGPVQLQVDFSGAGRLPKGLAWGAEGKIRGGAQGIQVEGLTLSNQNQRIAQVVGAIPIVLNPARTNGMVEKRPAAPLQLKADVEPGALSAELKAAGLSLASPELHIQLAGTLAEPTGRIDASAAELQWAGTNKSLPPLEKLRLTARVDSKSAKVEQLSFSVAGQPLVLRAELPLEKKMWSNLSNGVGALDWKQLQAELQADHVQLSALAPYLPQILSPEGEINGKVSLNAGQNLSGVLTLSGARTYPLGNVGSVRDILMRLRFEDRRIRLEAAGEVGGQPMPVTGTVDLRGEEWLAGKLPPFQLKVGGAKIPLSRTPELILKADLDVSITHDGKEPVTVSGNVNLRDGYYLQDLTDFTGGKVSTPERRPPYFSIEQQPLADWRLRLNVTGDKFLKVRSPLFNGVVSTALRLQGTLREPLATGEVTVNSGEVRFPFATMPVTQGLILLTSENPYRPQLMITAGARTYGYEVKMELTGFADAPVIQFSSIPALSSEQVLLMVSAGELPHGELTVSGAQKAQRLALFVGKDLLSGLGFSGDASRLTIRSGEDISEAGRPTYSVEYKLQENWAIVGEYDRFNDFNLMLKWRVYSK